MNVNLQMIAPITNEDLYDIFQTQPIARHSSRDQIRFHGVLNQRATRRLGYQ